MKWAQWRHPHCQQNAVRLHVKLRLTDEQPGDFRVTEGKICERAAMRQMLKPGEFYLGDRNYGADFALFDELEELACGYVLRLRNEAKWEVVKNHPLSPEAIEKAPKIGRGGEARRRQLARDRFCPLRRRGKVRKQRSASWEV